MTKGTLQLIRYLALTASTVAMLWLAEQPCLAQPQGVQQFQAIIVDSQGVESDVKQVRFYWEEKISETAFIPHEMREIPVKRGTATVNVKFEHIRQIEVSTNADERAPRLFITLANGKTGEFTLVIQGSFKGQSDFGEVEVPAATIKKLVFK